MSKNYKKRLGHHRKRIAKKLFLALIVPLVILLMSIATMILAEKPENWHSVNITVSDFSYESVWTYRHSSQKHGVLVTANGTRYSTPFGVEKTKELFKIGEEYELIYAKSYGINDKAIQGAKKGNEEIISLDSSISQYETNKSILLVITIVCIIFSAIATPLCLRFFCKEELKCIKQIKKKQAKNT